MKELRSFQIKQESIIAWHSLVRAILLIIVIVPFSGKITVAQDQRELDVIKNYWLLYSDAPNWLYQHLTGQAYRILQSHAEDLEKISSASGWQEYQKKVQNKIWDVIGPFPGKTPLNAKITGTVKKNGYKIENIIYESLPGFYVTASLFIPDKLKKPAPGILFCSGHSTGVYRLKLYQEPLLNLVMKGFVVLAIDPIGQGERLQYFDPQKGASVIGSSTQEHSYPSPQVFLLGKSVARYFVWDGIRGIDYLVSRKEVDPKRIGVHGLSGGGTQTAYISALDDRVAASAPAGYITSYRRLLESIGVQDGEQNFYHELSEGIDHIDFIIARAPKPTLIMATRSDFFSIQGTRETYASLKDIYSTFGKPDNIEMTEDDGGHGYTKKNREAMYAFFQKHLQLPGSPVEQELDFPTTRELQKTPTGQVSTSLGGETVFSLNRKEAEGMLAKLDEARSSGDFLTGAVNSARKLSGYTEPAEVQEPVFTGRFQNEGYVIEKYYVQGEGKYVIPYLLLIPQQTNGKSIIYLHPSDKSAEASSGGELDWFVKNCFTVLSPDLIGIGETGSGIFEGDAEIGGISYNQWYTSIIIGRSIAGIRAGDVSRLVTILGKRPGNKEIWGVAKKEMAPVMLFSAAFNQNISRVALIEPYSSYRSVVMNLYYYPGFVHNMVAGALQAFDLPDIEGSLAPRQLLLAGTTDSNCQKTDMMAINADLDIVRNWYKRKNAADQLIIVPDVNEKPFEIYSKWIK
jgi:hypothetical protein